MPTLHKIKRRFASSGVAMTGTVRVTEAGGNSAVRIYADAAGATKWPSHSLGLDSNGDVEFYVRPGREYRLTLVDSAGNIQAVEDNINPIAAGVESLAGDPSADASAVGAVNATTGLKCSIQRAPGSNIATLVFTLTEVELTVTDAAGSGSSASLKLFDFAQAGIVPLGCRQNYTAFEEGAALTGAAGDAAFVMGLGSVAANAGDGALTGTEVDFADATSTITLSGGTGTGTQFSGAKSALDGTATAKDLYLNWSGSAATIDANSTISVTGTIQLAVLLLGDD